MLAREHGSDALALAVRPRSGNVELQVSLIGPQGGGVSGATIRVGLGASAGEAVPAASCGPGCYRAAVRPVGRPARALVSVDGRSIAFRLPGRWPPASASALLARAARVWRGLRTLGWHERLASGPAHAVDTAYLAVAPDGLRYRVAGGGAAVLIGGRRWDRGPGGRWALSREPAVRQPAPYWAGVADARVLGSGLRRGRPVWRVSFFDPRSLAWFAVSIDKRTFRTLDLRMTAAAHFMRAGYGPFNRAVSLRPPRGAPPARGTARGAARPG